MHAELTIVIPTHNRRAVLPETVSSVLAERTVPLEVVVVDDASSDGTLEWLSTVTDPRVRYLRQDPGRGGSAARNAGLAEVTTEHVMFLDDDDLLLAQAIPTLLSALHRSPDAIASGGTYVTFGSPSPYRQPTVRVPMTRPIWREQVWGWNLPPGTSIWRTSLVREIGAWDVSLRRCEDLDINLRTYGYSVALTPATVLRYRRHAGQIAGAELDLECELDGQVRRRFLAGLPDRDRAEGERIIESHAVFAEALSAYVEADLRRATAGFQAALRMAPSLLRSPVLGPWLLGLLAKSVAGAAMPQSLRASVVAAQANRRRRRLEQAGSP